MKVLLSIKPEFAEKILSGEKKFEYRKAVFKRDVQTVIIYATSPVARLVGEFEIDGVLKESPCKLWNKTKESSGISRGFFDDYFSGRDYGYAIKVGKVKRYNKPLIPSSIIEKFVAPQSFRYVDV